MRPVAILSARTQHDNLGDAVIFGALVDLLRPHADVRVIDGDAPKWFLESADIDSGELIKMDAARELLKTRVRDRLTFRASRQVVLVYPGGGVGWDEGFKALKSALTSLARAGCLRAIGIDQLRLGFSYANLRTSTRLVERARHKVYTLAPPRDGRTSALFGMPDASPSMDLATASRHLYEKPGSSRSSLVASFCRMGEIERDKQADLSSLVRDAASGVELTVTPLSQVQRDDAGMTAWAVNNGFVAPICWDGTAASRDAVLDAYRHAAVVVSNRLHALLFGLYCGALPIAIVTPSNTKVASYFSTNGLSDLVIDAADIAQLPSRVRHALSNRPLAATIAGLRSDAGRSRLPDVVQHLFAGGSDKRRVVDVRESERIIP